MSKLRQMFYKAHNKKWLVKQLRNSVRWNELEKVKDLIAAKAPINEVDTANNYVPLHWAAIGGVHTEIIRSLIAAGAPLEDETLDGHTALDLAALDGKEEPARILLDAGAQMTANTRVFAASPEIKTLLEDTTDKRKHAAASAARAALEAAEVAQKGREDWLNAGMPLKKPLKVKKPLTFNKKPGK